MKRDVNFFLMGLLILALVSMVVMTIYYRYTYQELKRNYDRALGRLDEQALNLTKAIERANAREELLNKKEGMLIDYLQELNISKEREYNLTGHFTVLRGEKEELASELNTTLLERRKFEELYAETSDDLKVCKKDYNLKVEQLSEKNAVISDLQGVGAHLNSKIPDLDNAMDDLSDQMTVIDNKVKNNASGCGNMKSDVDTLKNNFKDLQGVIDGLRDWIAKLKT